MTVVKINAIKVPEGAGPKLEERFAQRPGGVEEADGFEGFELLRPTDGSNRYFVVTWWESEEAFTAWQTGRNAAKMHAKATGEAKTPVSTDAELLAFEVVERVDAPS
ncbi:MAG TPA: antibiotic biosynthesis monooxygenase [Microthrixaceae bacterium]|nr:antibiotic biosynthesis monooxygenase [Microthrixaceae bacterium]